MSTRYRSEIQKALTLQNQNILHIFFHLKQYATGNTETKLLALKAFAMTAYCGGAVVEQV